MNINSQVVSLNLAKKLKDLGVKQNSYFYHVRETLIEPRYSEKFYLVSQPHEFREEPYGEIYSVFTVAELGEILPPGEWRQTFRKDFFFGFYYFTVFMKILLNGEQQEMLECDLSEADVRAKTLITIIKNNDISKEWRKKWLI